MRVEDTLVLYFVKWTLLVQHFTTVHVCIAHSLLQSLRT